MTDTKAAPIKVDGKEIDVDFSDQNTVLITDRGGHSLKTHLFGGVLYLPFVKVSVLKQVRSFRMRPDDIYFPGYIRTGNHWTFEMTSMLLNGKAETIQRFKDHLELKTSEEFDKLPSPRIINTHMKLSDAPDDVRLKKVKVIYTLRDPKDVAVSIYNMHYGRALTGEIYEGSFPDYLQLFLAGKVEINGFFEHMRDAEKFIEDNPDVPVHFQRYEDTMKDPVLAVQKLSDFLGLPRNDDLCQTIATKCQFSRMKVDKDEYAFKVDNENFLFRKGTIGDWRNWFTDEMLEDYYRVYEEKMAGSRFYGLYARSQD